jgi:4-amino-4-deoxy-L-arabinose transferase-like glycosyltransferase
MDEKKRKIIVSLIVVVSILRIISVFTISTTDLIYDEASHMNIARGLTEGVDYGYIHGEYSDAYRPPVYPLAITPFFWIFGSSGLVARSVSAVFGILGAVVIYFLGKKMYSKEIGLYSSLILIANPMHWFYSSKALVEGVFIFLIILFLYTLYSSLKDRRYLIPTGVLLSLIFLTKYTGIVVSVFFILYILLWKRDLLKSKYFYLSIIFALLVLMPWMSFNTRVYGEPLGAGSFHFGKNIEFSEDNVTQNLYTFYLFVVVIEAALFLPFMLAGFYFMFKDKDRNFYPLILFFLLFLVLLTFLSVKRPRYLLPTLPILTIATAYCFTKLKALKFSGIRFERYILPLLIILVIGSIPITIYGFENYPRSERFRAVPEAGRYLQENCMDKKIYTNSYNYVWWYTHKESYYMDEIDFQEKNVCVFYDFFYASDEFELDLDKNFEIAVNKGKLKVYQN